MSFAKRGLRGTYVNPKGGVEFDFQRGPPIPNQRQYKGGDGIRRTPMSELITGKGEGKGETG